MDKGYMSQAVAPLQSDRVFFADQVVAIVIAETQEIAEQGAAALRVSYKVEEPSGTFLGRSATVVKPKSLGEIELSSGDVNGGMQQAVAGVDA